MAIHDSVWREFADALSALEATGGLSPQAEEVIGKGRGLLRVGAPGILPVPLEGERIAAMKRRKKESTKSVGKITGDFCTRENCGGQMIQTGTCKTCSSCGEGGGCG